jgi:hypothetical protein
MYNDTKTLYNKKLYVGVKNNLKKMYVELTINQETDNRTAQTINLETIVAYKSLSICGNGGQNIEEIADINGYKELYISKSDLNTIIDIWKKWNLNDMNAGTEKQKAFINEWKKTNRYDFSKACDALTEANIYIDNGYKYGSAWLIEILPNEIITKVISIFDKYNKPENTEQKINKAIYKNFEIKASYKGDKKADGNNDNFNNHMVKVTNTGTKQSVTFEFWASIAHPELNTEYDILNAFYCFVSDAVSGSYNFKDFCSEFGYDTDSRNAEKIHRKCKKQLEKLQKIYDGDIYELANELQEVAG